MRYENQYTLQPRRHICLDTYGTAFLFVRLECVSFFT